MCFVCVAVREHVIPSLVSRGNHLLRFLFTFLPRAWLTSMEIRLFVGTLQLQHQYSAKRKKKWKKELACKLVISNVFRWNSFYSFYKSSARNPKSYREGALILSVAKSFHLLILEIRSRNDTSKPYKSLFLLYQELFSYDT